MNRHHKIFKTSSRLSTGKALLNHIIFSPSQTGETVPLNLNTLFKNMYHMIFIVYIRFVLQQHMLILPRKTRGILFCKHLFMFHFLLFFIFSFLLQLLHVQPLVFLPPMGSARLHQTVGRQNILQENQTTELFNRRNGGKLNQRTVCRVLGRTPECCTGRRQELDSKIHAEYSTVINIRIRIQVRFCFQLSNTKL